MPPRPEDKSCDNRVMLKTLPRRPRSRAPFSEHLAIKLKSKREKELFKWFLVCLLLGKPIQTAIAEEAYRTLVGARLTSPDAILRAGWDKLVELLDQAHYVRYDFSTATKLLDVCGALKRGPGRLTNLIASARTSTELSKKLQQFKHVGPVTARIFLREVRPIWYAAAHRELGSQTRPKPVSNLAIHGVPTRLPIVR
jgi:hypothetical protein